MMKKVFASTILVIILCAFILLSGCSQPGETTAEGKRRHIRNARLNRQELNSDLDTLFYLDRPSKLSDKRIP